MFPNLKEKQQCIHVVVTFIIQCCFLGKFDTTLENEVHGASPGAEVRHPSLPSLMHELCGRKPQRHEGERELLLLPMTRRTPKEIQP